MTAIASLLIVLVLSVTITRFATIVLTHTGLSRESARFQARSAFTGVGFTTSESESMVNHPVRRRVVLVLMLAGNAGIVTAISTLILGMIDLSRANALWRLVALGGGVSLVWVAATNQWVDRHLSSLIDRLIQRYSSIDVTDFSSLLRLAGSYRVTELEVREGSWVEDCTLEELDLSKEGIIVLGVTREGGRYIGTPGGSTEIRAGDRLVLYGRNRSIAWLDRRVKGEQGDREHDEAVAEQESYHETEEREDDES